MSGESFFITINQIYNVIDTMKTLTMLIFRHVIMYNNVYLTNYLAQLEHQSSKITKLKSVTLVSLLSLLPPVGRNYHSSVFSKTHKSKL